MGIGLDIVSAMKPQQTTQTWGEVQPFSPKAKICKQMRLSDNRIAAFSLFSAKFHLVRSFGISLVLESFLRKTLPQLQ